MSLEKQLVFILKKESEKLISRYHEYHNYLHLEFLRNKKRLGVLTPKKTVRRPDYWDKDEKFNPFYVHRKHKSIARSIAKKIENKTYHPNAPFIKSIPKSGGGERKVSIFTIPDAAVSRLFYNRLLAKNKHRFSSFSYAYRNDRNVHFAIQDISVDLSNYRRIFVGEFDFSDFFGSISHNFLKKQFSANGFFISPEERFIIEVFLKDRNVGIPQGTSISLFLANLTCWKLDQQLEKEGVKFSRYADDTIIWSPDYSKICNSFNIMNSFAKDAGIKINTSKSDGISLLTGENFPSEITSKKTLDFLGYSLSVDNISIKDKSILKIKKQISYILYRNLIQPLKQTKLASQSIPSNNWDPHFLTAMMQIRRYMYGGLSKKQIKDFLSGRIEKIYFKGIMSFYPLVNNEKQLKELDGWLLSVIFRVVQLRAKLLKKHKFDRYYSFPFNKNRKDLFVECSKIKIRGKKLFEIPSFLLIYRALQKGLLESGIERLMNPNSLYYDYH